jgi:serine/threonine-protein kinase
LLFEIGGVYVSLGKRELAEPTMREAVQIGERAGPAALVWTEGARARLAHYALVLDGKPEAARDLDLAIARLRGSGNDGFFELAQALEFKADAAFNSGDYTSIPALSGEAVETHRRAGGDDSSEYANALGNHASLLRAIGRYGDALEPAAHAYRIVQALGAAAPPSTVFYVEQQYAGALGASGRGADAEPLLRDAFAHASTTPGTDQGLVDAIAWSSPARNSTSADSKTPPAACARSSRMRSPRTRISPRSTSARQGGTRARPRRRRACIVEQALQILCGNEADSPPCLAIGRHRAEALVALGRGDAARSALSALAETGDDAAPRAPLARRRSEGTIRARRRAAPRIAARGAGAPRAPAPDVDALALRRRAHRRQRGDSATALADRAKPIGATATAPGTGTPPRSRPERERRARRARCAEKHSILLDTQRDLAVGDARAAIGRAMPARRCARRGRMLHRAGSRSRGRASPAG